MVKEGESETREIEGVTYTVNTLRNTRGRNTRRGVVGGGSTKVINVTAGYRPSTPFRSGEEDIIIPTTRKTPRPSKPSRIKTNTSSNNVRDHGGRGGLMTVNELYLKIISELDSPGGRVSPHETVNLEQEDQPPLVEPQQDEIG